MKRFSDGMTAVILVVCLMGFIGYNFLAPVRAYSEEKKAVKEEKATKDTKAAKETKTAKKTAAPAKKAVKKEPAPVVAVATPVATIAKKVSVDIMGAGYDPGEEVRILFTDAEGMQTDIGYALEPAPTANKSGAFSTTWQVGEFISAKLVTPGVFTLTVTNNEFKPLAQTAIAFKEAPKPAASGDKGDKKDAKKDDKGDKKEGK